MRKGWIGAAIVLAVVCMLLIYYLMGGIAQNPSGFNEDDLNAPFINTIMRDESYPGPLGAMSYPGHVQYAVSYGATVFASFGGALELSVDNLGSNDVYVHHYFVAWDGSVRTSGVNCSRTISSGQIAGLGMLYFAGPGEAGAATLEIWIELWTSSPNGELWDDKGEMVAITLDLDIVEEEARRDWEVERNPVHYYNKVNELVDLDAVSPFVYQVRSSVSGNYSLLQIIEAYELVSSRIIYAEDEDNHWQSPAETIALSSGDCEDHSLLLVSLITALGGTCRVNLIASHAFPTVYVGNSSVIAEVVETIQTYYGNPVPVH